VVGKAAAVAVTALVALASLAMVPLSAQGGAEQPNSYVSNYVEVLNRSIATAKTLLSRWGVPEGSKPWSLIALAEEVLQNLSSTTDVGRGRELLREGMGYVREAVWVALAGYARPEEVLSVKEVWRYLATVKALIDGAANLRVAVRAALKRGVINESVASELSSELDEVVGELEVLRDYLKGVINGSCELNLTYVRSSIASAKRSLGGVKGRVNEAVIEALGMGIRGRLKRLAASAVETAARLRANAELLRRMGLVRAAKVFSSAASRIEARVLGLARAAEGLGVSRVKALEFLASLARRAYVVHKHLGVEALRALIKARAYHNVSELASRVEELAGRVEEALNSCNCSASAKELVFTVVNTSKDLANLSRKLVSIAAEGDWGTVKAVEGEVRSELSLIERAASEVVKCSELRDFKGLVMKLKELAALTVQKAFKVAERVGAEARAIWIDRVKVAMDALKVAKHPLIEALGYVRAGGCRNGSVASLLKDSLGLIDAALAELRRGDVDNALNLINNAVQLVESSQDLCSDLSPWVEEVTDLLNEAVESVKG